MSSLPISPSQAPRSSQEPRHWEGGAHFQAWYPVSVAAAVTPGKIIGRDFLNTRIIVYRGPDGEAVVQSGYCAHLGADLSDGEIVEGQVRCPYHHWRFGADGRCSKIPSGTAVPRAARIYNYPVAERWGLIWAFNGEQPLYDPPTLDGSEQDYLFIARERATVINSDSWIQGTNGVDFQHLTAVHNFPPGETHKNLKFNQYTIDYDIPLLFPDGKNRMYGANCIALQGSLPLPFKAYAILATNAPRPGVAESFWCAAVKQGADETREQALDRLKTLDEFMEPFFAQDEGILSKIRLRPRGQAMLIKDDQYLAKFLDWLETFPKQRPFDL